MNKARASLCFGNKPCAAKAACISAVASVPVHAPGGAFPIVISPKKTVSRFLEIDEPRGPFCDNISRTATSPGCSRTSTSDGSSTRVCDCTQPNFLLISVNRRGFGAVASATNRTAASDTFWMTIWKSFVCLDSGWPRAGGLMRAARRPLTGSPHCRVSARPGSSFTPRCD